MRRRRSGWRPTAAPCRRRSPSAARPCPAGRRRPAPSFEQNLSPLRDIYETGALPRPLDWHPLEVLSLTRWSEGERADHLARAFACAILCIDATSEAPRSGPPETVLPQLLDSCLRLGPEALVHLRGLAVALLESREEDDDAPLLCHGLLLCAAAVDPADPRLPALAARAAAP